MIPPGVLCTDVIPPTVVVTSPGNDDTVNGAITLAATAADNDAVANVQFAVDGVNVGGPITAPPYQVGYDTGALSPAAWHTFGAVATDRLGHRTGASNAAYVSKPSPPATPPPVPGVNGGVNSGDTLTGMAGPYFTYGAGVANGYTLQFRFYANFDNPEGKGLLMYGYFDDGASWTFNPNADAPANGGNTTDWYGPWTNVTGSASSPQIRARLDLMREFGGGSQTNIHNSQIQFQWV